MPSQFIPPNGFAGFAQQTPAVQSIYRKGRNGGSGRKRRRKAAKKSGGHRAASRSSCGCR